MDQKKIGKFIAQLRKKKSLTQRELANKLGISEKTVSKWECGNGMPEVAFMQPLCDFYGQYYQSLARNRTIYIEQAKLCKKMLVWFNRHIDELNTHLKRIAKESC